MYESKLTKIKMPSCNAFDFQIKYTETDRNNHTREIGLHTHSEFEIYINIAGDVSFLVENKLYKLAHGDVILARPGEHHHCVYRSNAPHKLFWILFDCQKNQRLLDFLREDFPDNYISPPKELREQLIDLCYTLHTASLTDEDKLFAFFKLFAILKSSKNSAPVQQAVLSQDLSKIIEYIDSHIFETLTIADLAKALYISQSSLERKFKEVLDMTPLEYIRRKKLVLAAEMLQEGKSVLAAGSGVGYQDTSYFIELFKKYYGVTPHQYKRKANKNWY